MVIPTVQRNLRLNTSYGHTDVPVTPRTPSARPFGLLLGTVLFAESLHYAHREHVAPIFSYLGYQYSPPSPISYMLVILAVFAVSLCNPRKANRPGSVLVWTMFILGVAPSALLPQFTPILAPDKALTFSLAVCAVWGIVLLVYRLLPSVWIPRRPLSPTSFVTLIVMLSVVNHIAMFTYLGANLDFVGLLDVADVRFGYRDALAASPTIVVYLLLWQGEIINPLIMSLAMARRKSFWLLIGGLSQVFIYGLSGQRLVLLSIPAVLIVGWLLRPRVGRGPTYTPSIMLPGAVVLIWGSLVVDAIFETSVLTLIFVNRLFVTPGILAEAHVSIFANLPDLRWSYSFMSPFFDYPYDVSPGFLVGTLFSGSELTHANANLFGDGYMNLGYAGMVLEAVVLGTLLSAINSASRRVETSVSVVTFLIPAIALTNTSPITAVLTHGLLLGIVLMVFLPSAYESRSGPGPRTRAP